HAASDGPNTGIIISSLNESYWKNHYYGFGRFLPSVKGVAQEDKSAASQGERQTAKKQPTEEEVASKKKSNNFNSRDARILCNVSASVDWRGVKVSKFAPNFRGIATQADITIGHWLFAPGVGAGVRWNYGCGVVQFPIYLTLLVSDYIRVYGGLIFTIGNAHSPGESTLIKAPVFPGMFGLSLFTPSLTGSRKVLVQLMQDFCYTIFKNADGTNLSSQKSYEAGFVLSTGVKISFPLG
ncbi:MAG: hypothetical protein IKI31_03810, partial [Treponema sp.]|nr:hypothetical protein [Treponema sp.]